MDRQSALQAVESDTAVSPDPDAYYVATVGQLTAEPNSPNVVPGRATLSLELQGIFGGLWGSLTRGITERYIAFEAKGLKARSENPAFRRGQGPG